MEKRPKCECYRIFSVLDDMSEKRGLDSYSCIQNVLKIFLITILLSKIGNQLVSEKKIHHTVLINLDIPN